MLRRSFKLWRQGPSYPPKTTWTEDIALRHGYIDAYTSKPPAYPRHDLNMAATKLKTPADREEASELFFPSSRNQEAETKCPAKIDHAWYEYGVYCAAAIVELMKQANRSDITKKVIVAGTDNLLVRNEVYHPDMGGARPAGVTVIPDVMYRSYVKGRNDFIKDKHPILESFFPEVPPM